MKDGTMLRESHLYLASKLLNLYEGDFMTVLFPKAG